MEEERMSEKCDDVEYYSCMLQPPPGDSDSDSNYTAIRRLLLSRKPQPSILRRKDWRCNGKGYVAFRNYINRPRNWENMHLASHSSITPVQSGNWMQSLGSIGQLSLLLESDWSSTTRDVQSNSQALSRSASLSSIASDNNSPRKKVEPAYSFVGMHCIFDQCKSMVTVLKFGHACSDILAYGSADGTLTVCTVSEQPSVIKQLTGHSKDVTDFDFSLSNQYLASSSEDKTVRVWDISKGICIRVIYGVSAQLCIRFHPVNNNFLSAGNANKEITVFNFSTGRVIDKAVFDGGVTAMDHDHTGQFIFCGDVQGSIYTVKINSHTGYLSRSHRNRGGSKQKSPVTTMQYRTFSLLSRGPVLLSFTRDGSLSYFSISLKMQGYLTLRCSLRLGSRFHNVRASFCPFLSLEKGEFIVLGSDDANVYFYDLTRPKHPVNKLQGHGYAVVGIAWNHGENLLASSDFGGTVIVWKRAKTK